MKGAEAAAKIPQMEGTKRVFTFPDDPLATPCGNIGIKPYLAKTEDGIIPAIGRAEKEMRSGRPALLEMMTKPLPKYGGGGGEAGFTQDNPALQV